jgi:ribonucleotide reductase beta subunit family protein with ferritin-like domain
MTDTVEITETNQLATIVSNVPNTSNTSNIMIEPLLDPANFRFTIKPINPNYQMLWDLYKDQQSVSWIAEEIDYIKDYDHFSTLNPNEQQFIKMVLAFFANSDGIVNFNLRERFLQEIQVVEALTAYSYQLMMENVHAETYADMLINIIKDPNERQMLFDAIKTVPSIKKMSEWALKWVDSTDSFAHRIIAFAIVEGVFFSGAFAAIFWLKKQRGDGDLFMVGLNTSNRFISRDEGLHVRFACALYTYVINRASQEDVKQMFIEANEISREFINDAIQTQLIGINNDTMYQYINYVSDGLLVMLGYEKIFNAVNPFEWMETSALLGKDNFFEKRPDAYQKSHNEQNKSNWEFKIETDNF